MASKGVQLEAIAWDRELLMGEAEMLIEETCSIVGGVRGIGLRREVRGDLKSGNTIPVNTREVLSMSKQFRGGGLRKHNAQEKRSGLDKRNGT